MAERVAKPLLVISQLPPPVHGSTVMTATLLQALEALGLAPLLIDRRFSRDVNEVGQIQFRKCLAALNLLARLLNALRQRPSACIFFITNRPASFIVDWALAETLRMSGTPIISYVHTSGFRALAERGGLWRFMVRRLLGAAHVTVCLGPRMFGDLSDWVDEARVRYIPNSTPPPPPNGAPRAPIVLFLSNLIPEKGADIFIEAAAQLAPSHPEWTFMLAGAHPDRHELERLTGKIQSSGHATQISIIGAVDNDTKWQLIRESMILVFPSRYRYEAQPLTIVECMAVGTPVVAFDIGGVSDIVQNEVSGVLIPADDLTLLVTAVDRLLRDEEEWRRLSLGARRFYENQHTPSAYTMSWREVLQTSGVLR